MRTLTRPELTAALAARQGLAARLHVDPAEAVRRLTPLQAQHPPAPYLALAARVEGFTREGLEAAITDGAVVKTTINRLTLHLAAAADYPAYAQLTRQARMRTWRKQFAHLDEERVTAELREWFREPRSNADVREHVGAYEGVAAEPWAPVIFARTLVPLIQLPPADTPLPPRFLGHWDQALLAYADRERIIPPELHPLAATVSGEPTFTVDGRVAGTWNVREGVLATTPLVELSRAQQAAVKEEARRTARFCGAKGP